MDKLKGWRYALILSVVTASCMAALGSNKTESHWWALWKPAGSTKLPNFQILKELPNAVRMLCFSPQHRSCLCVARWCGLGLPALERPSGQNRLSPVSGGRGGWLSRGVDALGADPELMGGRYDTSMWLEAVHQWMTHGESFLEQLLEVHFSLRCVLPKSYLEFQPLGPCTQPTQPRKHISSEEILKAICLNSWFWLVARSHLEPF